MRTTDAILTDLHQRADGGEDVRQQIIAHQTLARLRGERADAEKAAETGRVHDLDAQIRYWLTLVDEDVDERVAATPAKDSTKVAGPDPDKP